MPPKKESVVYPASKRKAPPFKPQRPSKVTRIPTTDSESSRPTASKLTAPSRQRQVIQVRDDDDGDSDDDQMSVTAGEDNSDSDEELDDNPLASKPKQSKAKKPTKQPPPKQKPPREVSPMSISSRASSNASPDRPPDAPNLPPPPSQLDGPPPIPQPLLVRLLHEHFTDEKTKIDKQAIQVLQKYFEVFIREAIAQAHEQKKQQLQQPSGGADAANEIDASWLELEDLDKISAGMLLDF